MACALFAMCLSLFIEQKSNIGRVVALDEAHKYMNDSAESQQLTESLLSTIRLQRHVAARIFISTQEPTISPKLLDLCSMTIVHRFTSPDWLNILKKHLAGASQLAYEDKPDDSFEANGSIQGVTPLAMTGSKHLDAQIFSKIVDLNTGEALVFAPSAVIGIRGAGSDDDSASEDDSMSAAEDGDSTSDSEEESTSLLAPVTSIRLRNGVLRVRIRQRVTADGGRSVMAA